MSAPIVGSITGVGQSVVSALKLSEPSAVVSMFGTYAGVIVAFEVSDDQTVWFPVLASRRDATSGPSTAFTPSTNGLHVWVIPTRGFSFVRVRSTAWTSGSMIVGIQPDEETIVYPTVGVGGAVDTEMPAAIANADGMTNPTAPQVLANTMVFNNGSWDRLRGNTSAINADTSSARTANGTGVTYTNYNGTGLVFFVNVTAVSGTTPAATFRVQESFDNGTTWRDVDTTNLQTASVTAAGVFKLEWGPGLVNAASASKSGNTTRLARLAWTITGTSPSFTFASWIMSTV